MTVRHVERPAGGDPVGALVFFHGYGGIPEEWVGFLDEIDPKRRFHGYLPEAPHLDPDGHRSWFRRCSTERPETQLVPVVKWLEGLPHRREQTVLGGCSQGTNLAYALALGPGQARPAGLLALGEGFATSCRRTSSGRCRRSRSRTDEAMMPRRWTWHAGRGRCSSAPARRSSTSRRRSATEPTRP